MFSNTIINARAVALATALVIPAASFGQATWTSSNWDSDGNAQLSNQEFRTGFADTKTFDAWDRDGKVGLSDREFATGMFSRWDANHDLQITQDEYDMGSERWYGSSYNTPFTNYDRDTSGSIDRKEFGSGWDNTYYTKWDRDGDSILSEDEYTTGIYDTADLNRDQMITVEEEGWFEGWFDGNDVEAEIEQVGDVF